MKSMISCVMVLCSMVAFAQNENSRQERTSFNLLEYGNHQAKIDSRGYYIADPVTRALMHGTNGADINKNSEIAGVSKRAYGFAHGHIMLRSSGATTSGTFTGGGSVGTGTTTGTAGMHGAGIGVNGKNLYAGQGIWGTAVTGKGIRINDQPLQGRSQK